MAYQLIMAPVSRPSAKEVERNPELLDRYVEIKTHSNKLLARYMPEFSQFFRELAEAFGDVSVRPMRILVPDEDIEFVRSLLDEAKRLEEV